MEICNNKITDQVFVYLGAEAKNKAHLINPNGIVLALNADLFTEPAEVEAEEALADGLINRAQYNIYIDHHRHLNRLYCFIDLAEI
jgi:hypothetical protein